MSHVEEIKGATMTDAAALALAAELMGGTYDPQSTSFQWFGYSVGDYPLPAGLTRQRVEAGPDAGEIRFPGCEWSVGVFRAADGRLVPVFDFWGSAGRQLQDMIGQDGRHLAKAYTAATQIQTAKQHGWRVQWQRNAAHDYQIQATR